MDRQYIYVAVLYVFILGVEKRVVVGRRSTAICHLTHSLLATCSLVLLFVLQIALLFFAHFLPLLLAVHVSTVSIHVILLSPTASKVSHFVVQSCLVVMKQQNAGRGTSMLQRYFTAVSHRNYR